MTGGKRLGHAEANLQAVHVGGLDDVDRESGGSHVIHPSSAASAVRILGDGDLRQSFGREGAGEGQGERRADQPRHDRSSAGSHIGFHRWASEVREKVLQ
jgi:hypothetical protein